MGNRHFKGVHQKRFSVFKRVQNKIHYAVSEETAAEVIYHRANAEKDFMGLMTFSREQPTLREAKISKNYLDEKELRAIEKAQTEYKKYKAKTFSSVEKDYLESIKLLEQKGKK